MVLVVLMTVVVGACGKKPAAGGAADAAAAGRPTGAAVRTSAAGPPEPVIGAGAVVPPMPADDSIGSQVARRSESRLPAQPLFFELDSSDVSAEGQKVLQANAAVLKKYPTWQITIEGHCDERGTAEYNLALGERRALAAKNYLVSLGIPADKVKTVSYGKEFPFDAGSRRRRVVEEPARAFRDHRKVRWTYEPTNHDRAWDLPGAGLRRVLALRARPALPRRSRAARCR